ncbi:hypothetical protein I6J39_34130 (plasmid) [Streptomyces californicus]|uniref:Small CPxCG-related zinc finger protein n=1 Tax=Streptomyces californicus TaxID=67351 RepID=A0ABX7JC84_9ACTN|nr:MULTISPECIES: hypothetical protein [Streptomyces]QRV32413.1 hypothetical protein I6J39_34130 [Streptomyces californicus]QRV45829.1 hypothetical protein I6J41_34055 [Streptomyces californicus]
MNTEPVHEDLCPLCDQPLTPIPSVVVRSNVPYPTRTDYLPHCDSCTSDPLNAQKWYDAMNARDES